VRESLLDSTVYIDLEKANKHRSLPWAVATLRNAIQYRAVFGPPKISTVSIAEILRGLNRDLNASKAQVFLREVENDFQPVNFDLQSSFLAGEILAKLDATGNAVGASDCMIAACAIRHRLALVTANTVHFSRIADLGYELVLNDWRSL
jgi:predicted nucleic acid-binding protein